MWRENNTRREDRRFAVKETSCQYSCNKNIIIHERLIKQSRRTTIVTDPIHLVTHSSHHTHDLREERRETDGMRDGLRARKKEDTLSYYFDFIFIFIVHTIVTHPILFGSSFVFERYWVDEETRCNVNDVRSLYKKKNKEKKTEPNGQDFLCHPSLTRLQ